MDETSGTYVDDECFDMRDYDDDIDHDTDDDTNDDADDDTDGYWRWWAREPAYNQSSRLMLWICFAPTVKKIISAGAEHRHLARRGGAIV